ncbi:MAG: HEAT repeat domain-containing protein, partial [Limisphaerales bacterium]
EPAGNLSHLDVLAESGTTFTARRAYATNEFLASTDNWFRPVNLAVGPDGALYVCDMYRKTIEHPDYLPEATRKITDFDSGKDMGRIYRIVSEKGNRKVSKAELADASTAQLCNALKDPNGWRRMTAHRLLLERKPSDAPKRLAKLSESAGSPETRVHALYLLDAMGALSDGQIKRALNDKEAPVREHVVQLAEPRLTSASNLSSKVITMANDKDAKVRFRVALALGEMPNPEIIPPLVTIALKDAEDQWTRAAVLSSIGSHPREFLQKIMPEVAGLKDPGAEKLDGLMSLFSDLGRSLRNESPLSTLREITRSEKESDVAWQIALLHGFADGLRTSKSDWQQVHSPLMSVVQVDSSTTPQRIAKLFNRAGEMAADDGISTEQRLAAIGLLSHASFEEVGSGLQKLIDPRQPAEIQIAAVRALAQMPEPEAAGVLVKRDNWRGYTQSVKDSVLGVMTAQPKLLGILFTAIEQGDISAMSINPERRNQLMRHKNQDISKRANALFADLKPSDRMAVYEEYKSVLSLKADPKNGRAIFAQSCMPCHVFGGEGYLVGPDLTGIRSQPADVILLHIIVPEFEMMPTYTQYNVETRDGQSFSGILATETPSSVTLRQALGIEQVIQRADISSMSSSTLSLMPQELEQTMSRQELADLIAFLKGE